MLRSLRREDGFGLAEVLASAAVLTIVVLGVYAGLDGTISVSGQNKARTVAAALAQQDQEQLRAQRATQLSNHSSTRTVDVSGVPYTVDSRTTWISDASGTESCSSSGRRADYLKISSSVTSPAMKGRPVLVESIIAPPAGGLGGSRGNLAVQLVDQAGAPVVGIGVTVTPTEATQSTNSVGCAFFGHLPAGSASARFGRAGWVNPGGVTNVVLTAAVASGATSLSSTSYAQAADVTVRFDTINSGGALVPTKAQAIAVANAGLPAPGFRAFTAAAPRDSIDATGLFPFASGYGVYAGTCAAANPTVYTPDYWTRNSGFVTTGPGSHGAVTVRMPSIRVAVRRSGAIVNAAHVVVRAIGSGCTDSAIVTGDSQGNADVPMPFGPYAVCADNGTQKVSANVTNFQPAGTARTTLSIPTGRGTVCT
ncbi:MAG: hypothetical protein QOE06_2438 [Thermoleophilaceae bacterium]|jgi:Tfp pilus assembly protein PilV|nr:hypothetical protein [Thermoleophilaceae bacterium]